MKRWLKTVKGENVAFTGQAWLPRWELQRIVRRLGGTASEGAEVTTATTVLVRGRSAIWEYGDHGLKERYAARLMREGHKLVVVPDSEFRKLVEKRRPAQVLDRVAGEPIEWIATPSDRSFRKVAQIAGALDREHTAYGRVEQGYLRRALFGAADVGACCICRRKLPVSLLVAAHIKPRSECSRRERLDGSNIVFPACLLGCDALYEQGLVSVDGEGMIVCASRNDSVQLRKALSQFRGMKCPAFTKSRAAYFDWHLRQRFQG